MQSGLGNEGIIVLLGEPAGAVEGSRNDADGLELSTRVTDGVLVNGKGLCKEFVTELFEARLVRHFSAHHKQTQGQISTTRVHTLVEVVDTLVHEPVKGGRLRLPVVVVVLAGLEFACQTDRTRDQGRCCVSDTLVTVEVGLAGCLE